MGINEQANDGIVAKGGSEEERVQGRVSGVSVKLGASLSNQIGQEKVSATKHSAQTHLQERINCL